MSPLSIRRRLRRGRRLLALVLVVLGLGGAVAVHHGMPMAGDGHGHQMAMTCLAVLQVGAALTIVAAALHRAARRRRWPWSRWIGPLVATPLPAPPPPRARAGPPPEPRFLRLAVIRR
ncbi:hypothetical protein [Patulibacter defluvii]|uniref:hypothetical protein n=1 Tax=Patulibacter defluvii TaxID=3095358 RepID=UPI002A75D74C|nr:hypothetical protein [Patulibacter sp. DM4]